MMFSPQTRSSSPLALAALLACATPGLCASGNHARVGKPVAALMDAYCIRCHGPKKQKGNFRLDTVSRDIKDATVALQWQDILDKLNLSEMPPEDAKQPPREVLANALESLTGSLVEARKRLTDSGGHVVLRRLNRREYRRTIQDLVGVPVDTSLLPEDGRIDGFDTLGQANSFSSLHLERYLELGRRVLDDSFEQRKNWKRGARVKREEAEKRPNREIKDQIGHVDKKIENFKKNIASGKKQQAPLKVKELERRLIDTYLKDPRIKDGALIPMQGMNPATHIDLGRKPRTGRYRFKIRLGAAQDKPAKDLYLKVIRGEHRSAVPDDIHVYRVTGTMAEPQTIEFEAYADNVLSNRFEFRRWDIKPSKHPELAEAKRYWFRSEAIQYHYQDTKPDLWVDWVEAEGPMPGPPAPASMQALFGDKKTAALGDADAEAAIKRFARVAFRGEAPGPAYVGKLMGIYKISKGRGASFDDAIKDALVVVLASPRFLFLNEPGTDGAKPRPLAGRALAVRLAYFLWSAPPDETLMGLAEAGNLRSPQALAEQVDRMVRSPKSAHFVETFTTQWLELDRLDGVNPEGAPSPVYDRAVQVGSRREVYAFFNTLLQENLPATDILGADYAVLDPAMARFYGVGGVTGEGFRKVKLSAGSVRGGLLGQSAVLTLTGTGDRTSPVERGAWVLRKLLHRPPPAAPANVPMLDEENIGARSIRETLAAHMDKPQCKSCHRRIDPLGFALEHFDPVGLWREDVASDDGKRRFAIDPAGVMPDGTSRFKDLAGMKAHLATAKKPMLAGLTESMMTYALGRTIGFTDQEAVERIVDDTARAGYGLRTLVHKIVQSPQFLSK